MSFVHARTLFVYLCVLLVLIPPLVGRSTAQRRHSIGQSRAHRSTQRVRHHKGKPRHHRPLPHGVRAYDREIRAAAKRHRVPAALVRSVMAAESGGRPWARSRKGAQGLMQLMPATARQYGARGRDPRANINAGTKYLAHLLNRYRHRRDRLRCAVAAYNAGPTRVRRYGGVPPFRETRTYVARVLGSLERSSRQPMAE